MVRERQDESILSPREPEPTGQLVGIEKPVPVFPRSESPQASNQGVSIAS